MREKALENVRVSIIFETEALCLPNSPKSWNTPFLNLVVVGTTSHSPLSLLRCLKEIEQTIGRDLSAPRWAPRVIDLDILAWDDQVIAEETLKIPHPELMNRPFLLTLMASLRPHWRLPHSEKTLAEIASEPVGAKSWIPFPRLVGIVNVTPDSFSDGGKYLEAEKALAHTNQLIEQGAAVIDLGAQSTRPGAHLIPWQEEWQRLEPLFHLLRDTLQTRPARPRVSLDTFHPEVVAKALELYPIDWVNDVQGGTNEDFLRLVADTNCKIVLYHSLTVPASKTKMLPFDREPISYLTEWAERKIDQLQTLGIAPERIILDPGIGFNKTALQSCAILKNIRPLKIGATELLIGHSRKSFLKMVTNAADRDLETIGISHSLLTQGVDYLRVHNVEAHQRSLAARAFVEGLS